MAGCGSDCLSCYAADVSCCSDWASLDEYVQCRSLTMAWDTLRLLSGGRVNNCAIEMRPCLQAPCDACSGYWESEGGWGIYPRIVNGCWVNTACGGDDCSCERMCEILFPGEVAKVCSVKVDGEELQVDHWRVDNRHSLVRTDDECWPSCQDLAAPPDRPNTMSVTYIPGIPIDTPGMYAAGVLACEYAKLCNGGKCRLPQGITSIVRQGVSMQFNTEQFPGGLTGLAEVDSYISSINPFHHKMPVKVWSPDMISQKHRFSTQESYVPL